MQLQVSSKVQVALLLPKLVRDVEIKMMVLNLTVSVFIKGLTSLVNDSAEGSGGISLLISNFASLVPLLPRFVDL